MDYTFDSDDEILSSKRRNYERLKEMKKFRQKHMICVLENPDKWGNIGAVIRNVEAFGVGKLYIIGDGYKDRHSFSGRKSGAGIYGSDTYRHNYGAAMGADKWIYVREFKDTKSCIDHLRKKHYKIAVTSPHDVGKKNYNVSDANFTCNRLAIVFGNEKDGISREFVEECDFCVQVPMYGMVESLNLSVCSGIVLQRAVEKRLEYMKRLYDRKCGI